MKKLAAEFFGTLWLVLGGCGNAVLAAAFPEVGIGLVGVSLAFELTVLTMVYAVALFADGWALQQLWLFIVAPIVAPIVGAVIGAVIHKVLLAED